MKKLIKKIIKKVIKKVIFIFKLFPKYEECVKNYCYVGNKKSNFLGRIFNSIFWMEYYSRSVPDRINIQSKLMGGSAGVNWANNYNKLRDNYPPIRGKLKVGNLDWYEACPGFEIVKNLLNQEQDSFCFIQLGASSGKEISYFATKFPEAEFIYTDIFEQTTLYAESKLYLPNLKYVTCAAENLAALANVTSKKKVIIFSSGSAQYVLPENLEYTFKLLSNIKKKDIYCIFDEPGNDLNINPLIYQGSYPRGDFSYTHNYEYYAEKYGFKSLKWNLIKPYSPQEDFYPNHQGTVHLNGFFRFSETELDL